MPPIWHLLALCKDIFTNHGREGPAPGPLTGGGRRRRNAFAPYFEISKFYLLYAGRCGNIAAMSRGLKVTAEVVAELAKASAVALADYHEKVLVFMELRDVADRAEIESREALSEYMRLIALPPPLPGSDL